MMASLKTVAGAAKGPILITPVLDPKMQVKILSLMPMLEPGKTMRSTGSVNKPIIRLESTRDTGRKASAMEKVS